MAAASGGHHASGERSNNCVIPAFTRQKVVTTIDFLAVCGPVLARFRPSAMGRPSIRLRGATAASAHSLLPGPSCPLPRPIQVHAYAVRRWVVRLAITLSRVAGSRTVGHPASPPSAGLLKERLGRRLVALDLSEATIDGQGLQTVVGLVGRVLLRLSVRGCQGLSSDDLARALSR